MMEEERDKSQRTLLMDIMTKTINNLPVITRITCTFMTKRYDSESAGFRSLVRTGTVPVQSRTIKVNWLTSINYRPSQIFLGLGQLQTKFRFGISEARKVRSISNDIFGLAKLFGQDNELCILLSALLVPRVLIEPIQYVTSIDSSAIGHFTLLRCCFYFHLTAFLADKHSWKRHDRWIDE